MAYSRNKKNTNANAVLQDVLPCKCCSLSTNKIHKNRPIGKGMINMKNFKCEATLNAIEKRHGSLIAHRQHLSEKISAMEKTVPLLMAYNIWMSGNKDGGIVVNRMKDIVNELLPNSSSDSVEKMIEDMKNRVGTLNAETTKLHEKIIEADMKLEESGMMLESLQVINNEMNDRLKVFEGFSTREMNLSDLKLLDRDDLNCLSKLRRLIQQEIHLKNGINALEDRENRIHTQLNRILSASERLNNNIELVHAENSPKSTELCECCKCDDLIADTT